MSIRDYVLNPLVIRTLNRTIRRALGRRNRGGSHVARILIVEHDPLIREMLATTLRDAGYETATASDGHEALERIEAAPADVVITDVLMPDGDGMQAIVELRRRTPGIRLLAISGGSEMESARYLRGAESFGATRTLVRPFDNRQLLDAVDEIVHK
jgi:DNA-binding response OmpR family regulator